MTSEEKQERRSGYVEVGVEFLDRVIKHMDKEEGMHATLEEGAKRMDAIEQDLSTISKLVQTANGFVKAVRLVTVVATALLGLFGWVVIEKNNDVKAMQQTLNQHSIQISQTLAVLQRVVVDQDNTEKRLDRYLDSFSSGNGRNRR